MSDYDPVYRWFSYYIYGIIFRQDTKRDVFMKQINSGITYPPGP